jgi:Na+:H+ antiporter, NhaA family
VAAAWHPARGHDRRHLLGVGALAGIGFTVSLFIADLAYFPVPEVDANTAKVGILAASLVSGLLGGIRPGRRPA